MGSARGGDSGEGSGCGAGEDEGMGGAYCSDIGWV